MRFREPILLVTTNTTEALYIKGTTHLTCLTQSHHAKKTFFFIKKNIYLAQFSHTFHLNKTKNFTFLDTGTVNSSKFFL